MAKLRLGEILLAEGKIDEAQLKAALSHQRRWGKKIGSSLVDLGFLDEIDICKTLSRALRLPLIDVTRVESESITREILDMVPIAAARRNRLVPLAIKNVRRKRRLVVATSDPTNYGVLDDIQFKASLPLLVMIAPDSDIDWFLRKYYMNEGEALPENYVSGISLIEPRDKLMSQEGEIEIDPIEKIFENDEFTSASKVSYDPSRKNKKD